MQIVFWLFINTKKKTTRKKRTLLPSRKKKGIKLILGLLWVLYRKYRMAVGLGGGDGTKKAREEDMLLEWARTVLRSKGFEEN